MNNWKYLMIHHSLTKDGQVVDFDAIKKYHIETKRWQDIGYHFVIELINNVYIIKQGRNLEEFGGHCIGMNEKAIGICLVGNFDVELPPTGQIRKLKYLGEDLRRRYSIPVEKVVCHNEYADKTCPGKLIKPDIWRLILA